ncbi:hypothetical protein ACFJIX_17880 [Roseateles sp. UC29_93]|uniref:hypothetical protein n=1 Tax=Roseateles sp. UC29_93 TaxID=3350177 RepID=UPI00366FB491
MPSNGPNKRDRIPNAASNRMNFLIALWELGGDSPATSVTFEEVRVHMGIEAGTNFSPKFVQHAKQGGLVATMLASHKARAYLTEDGVETLKLLHKLGRVSLERLPHQPATIDRSTKVAGPVEPFVWPLQANGVRSCCHGYVAGGAASLPAIERADGLTYRQHPSRRGDELVYPDGRVEPMPAEGPWPAVGPKRLRAWDLEQVAAAETARKAA